MDIPKIVSGGQTGVDRAGLDWALARGVKCGGWCPRGRKAEDGPISRIYPLAETPSADYAQRTEWNVRDTGGTVIFSIETELAGGSKRTAEFAVTHNKPCLHLHSRQSDAAQAFRDFIAENKILVLNIAGPRASEEPEVGEFAKSVLAEAFPGSK